jgi:WXG100 family type VII secretion target
VALPPWPCTAPNTCGKGDDVADAQAGTLAGTQAVTGSGSGGFGTTVEEMARAGRQVLDVDAEVQADLAALRGQLVPLQGAWVGEAATSFTGLMVRWDADARALSEALRAIGEAILGSGRTYQQQEESQYGGLSAIRAALG